MRNVAPALPGSDPAGNLRLGRATYELVGQQPFFEINALDAQTDATEFSVQAGPSYLPLLGIESGRGTDVTVTLTPKSLGTRSVELLIFSNDFAHPVTRIPITANAVQLPPCIYSVRPTSLSFGLVAPGAQRQLEVAFTNQGTSASDVCLLSGASIPYGSDAAFSLAAGQSWPLLVQPRQTAKIGVTVAPTGTLTQQLTGALQFFVSNPTNPKVVIPLDATVGASCLVISPAQADFGTVQQGCASATRTFSIFNTCATPAVLNSVKMVGPAGQGPNGPNCAGSVPCPEFVPVSTAALTPNTTFVKNAAPVTFSLRYQPIDLGADLGGFMLNVTQNGAAVDEVISLAGNGDAQGLTTDTFLQTANPKTDILVVVDNSNSMSDKQVSLTTNCASYFDWLMGSALDFQIGVTTTDMSLEAGRLLGTGTSPKVVTRATPDAKTKFMQKFGGPVGISGSGVEEILAPAAAAVTPPLSVTDNLGLLRQSAHLAVVAVSDNDDGSPQPVSTYVSQLQSVKSRPGQLSFSSVGPYVASRPGCGYSTTTAKPAVRVPAAVAAIGGVQEDICEPTWNVALQQFGTLSFGQT